MLVIAVWNLPTLDLKERLRSHLVEIARERDPYLASWGHFYVRHYIRKKLEEWGPVVIDRFGTEEENYQNLILNLPARARTSNRQRPLILIGAHYDAVPGSPGADDNATGVAVLLELARLLTASPPRSPVQLIAFDMEEFGLQGSRHYASELKLRKQPLRLMFSLEMLGYCDSNPGSQRYPPGLKYFYPSEGNFIALIGNLGTIPDLIRLSRTVRQQGVPCEWLPAGRRGRLIPDTRRSDHAAFWDQGYRAVMVTDTANMRNPHYHQASDRINTIDLDFLTSVCLGLSAGVRQL